MTHLPSESAAALTLESANSKPLESTTHSTPNILANASHESPTANSLSLYKQYSKSKMVYSDDETTIREKVVKIPKYSFGLDGTIVSAEGLNLFADPKQPATGEASKVPQSKSSTKPLLAIDPPKPSKSCLWHPRTSSSSARAQSKKNKVQPLQRKNYSVSPRQTNVPAVSTPKLIKPIEDTPDIGSVFLSYFGEPSEPPLSPKPKQDEWTRFAAAQNHLCAQAPVPQRSRLRRRTQASAEHKNWSEWSVPAPASSKVNKHKKVSRHLLRKKSSDPPCVLNISRPIPVGPIETTGIHPPEWYPNRFCGIEVAIDQIGLTVTRPQNDIPVLQLPRPQATPVTSSTGIALLTVSSTSKALPPVPSTAVGPSPTPKNTALLDIPSTTLLLPPFSSPHSAARDVSPPPSTTPHTITRPQPRPRPRPQNPWAGKNWMYRNRIIYLSRSGISSFSFLEVIPNPKSKPPKVTTIYDSQTGDPEFNVSFREDIGPFRKAAVWEWMTRGVGRAELEKSEKKVKQRRRFATYVLGNGNAPGSSGLRTEVLTDEEEKVREEKNRIVYDEWQKLLNGEGEW